MGYRLDGVCHVDVATALQAWQAKFPLVSATVIYNLDSSSISAGGLITYVATSKPMTSATITTAPSATIQLSACSNEFLGSYPVQDILLPLAIVVCWALGFQAGMHR